MKVKLVLLALGLVTAPLTFWLYWLFFDIGNPDGMFKTAHAECLGNPVQRVRHTNQ
jgi:hypothetical protein